VVRVALEPVADRLPCFGIASQVREARAAEGVLPARRLEPFRLGADRDDDRVVLRRVRDPSLAGLEQDESTGRRVQLLPRRLEPRAATDDEVELLVLVGVLLDDELAGVGRVRVDPEGVDAEREPDGLPAELVVDDG
jgi:hypothetical protein